MPFRDVPRPPRIAINRFTGGKNSRDDSIRIRPDQCTSAQNIHFRGNTIVERNGYIEKLSSALSAKVIWMLLFKKSDSSKYWLAATSAGELYTVAADLSSTTLVKGDFTASDYFNGVQYLDKVYMVNGIDGLWEWDGTTIQLVASYTPAGGEDTNELADASSGIHTCKYITVQMNLLFLAGSSGTGTATYVYTSDLTQGPAYFKTGDIINVENIPVGLSRHRKYVLIWKEGSVDGLPPLQASTDYDLQRFTINARVGAASGGTVRQWNDYSIFLSKDGVYSLHSSTLSDFLPAKRISDLIQPDLETYTYAQKQAAWAEIYDDFYILAIGGKWYLLDLRYSNLNSAEQCCWSGPWDIAHGFLWEHPETKLLYSSHTGGQIYLQDTGNTDNGTNIATEWFSGWMDMGRPEVVKLFRDLWMHLRGTTNTCDISLILQLDYTISEYTYTISLKKSGGFVLGTSLLGTGVLGYADQFFDKRITPPSTARFIRIGFRHNANEDRAAINSFVAYMQDVGAW